MQASSKTTVLAILEKAREVCIPIQTAKKTVKPKSAKASANTAAAESAIKDLKKSNDGPKKSAEEPKKAKAGEARKTGTKKVIYFSIVSLKYNFIMFILYVS